MDRIKQIIQHHHIELTYQLFLDDQTVKNLTMNALVASRDAKKGYTVQASFSTDGDEKDQPSAGRAQPDVAKISARCQIADGERENELEIASTLQRANKNRLVFSKSHTPAT